jgi:hypothetical protein
MRDSVWLLVYIATLAAAGCATNNPRNSSCNPTRPADQNRIPAAAADLIRSGTAMPTGASAPPLSMVGTDSLWVEIPPDGVIWLDATGTKFPTYRLAAGKPTISGRRTDGAAGAVEVRIDEGGYGEMGFLPVSVGFPTAGCWEVTFALAQRQLNVVVMVRADGGT